MIECKQRSDITYRCTKITKVSGKIVEIDHYETHPERRVVVRDRPIYKKVLGSRRYLATVFWSLSTAASDRQRKRAFVKLVCLSQHPQPESEFQNDRATTTPNERSHNIMNQPKKYTALASQHYILSELWHYNRSTIFFALAEIIAEIGKGFGTILIPSMIVAFLEQYTKGMITGDRFKFCVNVKN